MAGIEKISFTNIFSLKIHINQNIIGLSIFFFSAGSFLDNFFLLMLDSIFPNIEESHKMIFANPMHRMTVPLKGIFTRA